MTVVRLHPVASSAAVSRRMSAARRRDTKPELDVRRRLHAQGFRYRVEFPVPGFARRTIDIAFTKKNVAVFIDGCFWHNCPEHGTSPRSNSEWWETKLRRNTERDAETTDALITAGWCVLRFWEHSDADSVASQIRSVLVAVPR